MRFARELTDKPKFIFLCKTQFSYNALHICIFSNQLKFLCINFQKPLDKFFTKVYNTPIKSDERKQVDRRRPHREPSDGARRRGGFG